MAWPLHPALQTRWLLRSVSSIHSGRLGAAVSVAVGGRQFSFGGGRYRRQRSGGRWRQAAVGVRPWRQRDLRRRGRSVWPPPSPSGQCCGRRQRSCPVAVGRSGVVAVDVGSKAVGISVAVGMGVQVAVETGVHVAVASSVGVQVGVDVGFDVSLEPDGDVAVGGGGGSVLVGSGVGEAAAVTNTRIGVAWRRLASAAALSCWSAGQGRRRYGRRGEGRDQRARQFDRRPATGVVCGPAKKVELMK